MSLLGSIADSREGFPIGKELPIASGSYRED